MASISLQHVSKIYKDGGKKENLSDKPAAVKDFNLEIADQEFVVLVGPSGCGKSTTLRMIAGLEDITSGELYIDGRLMNMVDPKDRNIAMVFQDYALYPHMTVYDNMAFGLKHQKMAKAEIDKRVRETAETLGITEYLDRKPRSLSGGQRQRVAIGRAIVRNPVVFLMDEPLSNLDAKLRNQMRSEIIKLHQRIKTTFVYVTHDQTEAMTLGDRIVVMKDGEIQQVGKPQQVFDHPANQFVAGFIGTPQMNFFPARLVKKGDGYTVTMEGYSIPLNAEKSERLRRQGISDRDVVLGIRPDYVYPQENGIEARVDVIERMGTTAHLHLDVNGKECIMILSADKLRTNQASDNPDRIRVSFDPRQLQLFDAQSAINLEG